MGLQAATAGSEHPVPGEAVAECAGALLDAGMHESDLLWVCAGLPFAGALVEMSEALRTLLCAGTTAAVASESVLMGGRVSRGGPSLGVMAVRDPSIRCGWLAPGALLTELLADLGGATNGNDPGAVALMAADPFSVRPDDLRAGTATPVSVLGGYLMAGSSPGTNRLVVDGREHHDGSAVVLFPPGSARTMVVHGVAVLSSPMVVTAADDHTVTALDDLPAAEAFEAAVASADPEILSGATEVGLRPVGRAELVGVRRSPGGLATSEPLATGEMVEPAVRSVPAAASEMAAALDAVDRRAASGAAAMCFLDQARPGGLLGPTSPGGTAAAGEATILAEHLGAHDLGLVVGGVFASDAGAEVPLRGVTAVALLGR